VTQVYFVLAVVVQGANCGWVGSGSGASEQNVERNRFGPRRATFVTDSVNNVAWLAQRRLRSTFFGHSAHNVAWLAQRRLRSTFFAHSAHNVAPRADLRSRSTFFALANGPSSSPSRL
jgi:hypothetical protein